MSDEISLLPDATPLRPGLFRSCGPAPVADLALPGIGRVGAPRRADPEALFAVLRRRQGAQDICLLDQLRCVTAQARDPQLPAPRRDWFWWSRQRKGGRLPPLPPAPEDDNGC